MRFLPLRRRSGSNLATLSGRRSTPVAAGREHSRDAGRNGQASAVLRRAAWCEELENRTLFNAELILSSSASPAGVINPGGFLTYTIVVRNAGTNFASNVVVTDAYSTAAAPGLATFVSATQIGGPTFTVNSPAPGSTNPVTFTIGQFNTSIPAAFQVVLQVGNAALDNSTVTNTASIARTEGPGDVDNPFDNSTTSITVVNRTADLEVLKELIPVANAPAPVTTGAVVAGLDAQYKVTVRNNGVGTAINVLLTDVVPQYTTYVDFDQTSGPTFAINPNPAFPLPLVGQAGTLQATISTLAPGATAEFLVTLHVGSNAPDAEQVFNTAIVGSDTTDPNGANNLVTVAADIEIQTDIRVISSSDKINRAVEGTFFPYTFSIYNAGPSDAQDVTFRWTTPNTPPAINPTDIRPFDRMVYDRYGAAGTSFDLVSGPAFTVATPPRPPGVPRGTYNGGIDTLPAGVGSTYKFWVGTPQQQDLVQNSSGGTASPDYDTTNNAHTDLHHVYDAPLTLLTAPTISGAAGQGLDLQSMTFRDENKWPGNNVTPNYDTPLGRFAEMNDFFGSVNWGDGTTSAGVISLDVTGTSYRVTAQHAYAAPGAYPVSILIVGDGESIVLGSTVALIGNPPRGGSQVGGLKFTENVSETKQVASFYNGGAGGTPTGTINWGDGKPNSAATFTPDGTGGFRVGGTHLYDDEGTYAGSITVNDGGAPVTIAMNVTVDDRAVVATAQNIVAQTATAFTGRTVATFTDPGGNDAVTAYSALIDWGDGTTPSVGTIVLSGGVYSVQGAHTYATAGTYNMVVTIQWGVNPTDTVTVNPTATVADGPINPAVVITGVNVTGNTNQLLTNRTVATFTDPSGDTNAGNFLANIDWGDGTPVDVGTITRNATTGVFTVTGSHTYTAAGVYNMTVTVRHGNSPNAVATPTATITDSNAVTSTTPVSFSGIEGQTKANQVVARFTTSNPAALATNFKATINWGDGTLATGGTIVRTGPGQFNVVGTHLFKADGSFSLTVNITATGQAAVTVNPRPIATITDAALTGISRLFNVTKNTNFTGIVGSFKDANVYDTNPGEYAITINWGDGTATSTGTAVYDSVNKRWNIRGSHRFTRNSPVGGFKVVSTIKDGTSTTKVTSTATVR